VSLSLTQLGAAWLARWLAGRVSLTSWRRAVSKRLSLYMSSLSSHA